MTAPLDTKQRILDEAERLFAENGFAGTSLRRIIGAAEVNLAAVHYHFHSKESLLEAVLMRHVLSDERFVGWFDRFLLCIVAREPATLFAPATVTDRSDGKLAHLDGLNLSRAWCQRTIARALPAGDARIAVLDAAANEHLAAGIAHVAGDYMGEHWLATFALLALEA